MAIGAMVIAFLLVVLLLESLLRFYLLRYSPFTIRLAYALFLLSPRRTEENIFIHKRIIRGGFRNEKELFRHYEKISGKPYREIERKFGREKKWTALFSRKYYSGAHGAIEQMQKMHLGLVPKPDQKLQTLEINNNGWRKTGFDPEGSGSGGNEKICLVLGNSVVFGAGATSDENTIAGRIGYYLNEYGKNNPRFYVVNHAISGANSLQETVCLLQAKLKPDYVVSLSGFNDPDQAFFSDSRVATWPQFCDSKANDSAVKRLVKGFLDGFAIYRLARRFISVFIAYDDVHQEAKKVKGDRLHRESEVKAGL